MVTDNENRLPIHTAAASAFLPGLRALLAVDPSCVRALCAPPIAEHNASSSSLTSSALYPIDMIVQYYDTVVKELDEIRTKDPILVEKKHTAEEAIEVILMTSLYGRAIFLPRDQTEAFLPLHAALLMETRDATWRTLLTMYKNLHAEDVDELGRNLLHLVAMDPSAAGSRRQGIVREIHAMFPTAVQRENKDGLIPLQVAIMYNAGEEITKPLIEYRETTFRRRYVR
mmetsp:Transcript_11100/g.15858  ORF Transcript_11100/g.15858 Transcript_11100/m.15858 type:complete len:228 (+) Transcript_11100:1-684(+)